MWTTTRPRICLLLIFFILFNSVAVYAESPLNEPLQQQQNIIQSWIDRVLNFFKNFIANFDQYYEKAIAFLKKLMDRFGQNVGNLREFLKEALRNLLKYIAEIFNNFGNLFKR